MATTGAEKPRLERVLEAASTVSHLLAENPEQVNVSVHNGIGDAITLRVRAPRNQLGNVIGTTGRNARSLRILMTAMMAPERITIVLDISELTEAKPVGQSAPN